MEYQPGALVNRAIFLDRDGVINQRAVEGEYITRWEDFHVLPGVAESIALLNRAGFRVIVITNQRCVAKQQITEAALQEMHRRMSETLTQQGAAIDAVYYCPHDLEPACECRKPEPGMILQASREWSIDLKASWMIGDSPSDIEAGRRAGCKTIFLNATNARALAASHADLGTPTLLEAVRTILSLEKPLAGAPALTPAYSQDQR
jgi:D-glycero-D-manno-heptose 1,7-bisphosphate phosphatase